MTDRQYQQNRADEKRNGRVRRAVRSWVSYYGNLAASLACIIVIWYVAAHWVDDSFKFPMIEGILGKMGYAVGDAYVWRSVAITMRRETVGVFWGAVIGFPIGMAWDFPSW